ncbi:MAG: ATP phosphoribosyltransferase [Candidatus Helarchaeota archaeon]
MNILRFTIPKGSLGKATKQILKEAGLGLRGSDRSYRPKIIDAEIEIKILRPQEIPTMIAQGAHDLGISGNDWVDETSANVENILDLEYGGIKLVLAVPNIWDEVQDLASLIKFCASRNKPLRIFTEYIATTIEYLKKNPEYARLYGDDDPLVLTPWSRTGNNSNVCIMLSFGATEAKPPEDAEAIIDVTETGTTLEENNLKIIDVIKTSTAHLLANKEAMQDSWKREKIEDIKMLLRGVVEARNKLHVFMNVQRSNLKILLEKLPALKRPTISPLYGDDDWVAINTIIPKKDFISLIPTLRRYAQGIVVYEPRQILPFDSS